MRASESVIFDPELGLDYTRVVHGEQRFSYDRPIVAGDELIVATTIESIRTMAGNDMITTRGDVSPPSRRARRHRARPCSSRARRRRRSMVARVRGTTSRSAPSCRRSPSPDQRADLVRYAGASGDFNVIHWNERVAASVGLPNVIAHGMLTMAAGGTGGHRLGRGSRRRRRVRRALHPSGRRALTTTRGATIDVTAEVTAKTEDRTVLVSHNGGQRWRHRPGQGAGPRPPRLIPSRPCGTDA